MKKLLMMVLIAAAAGCADETAKDSNFTSRALALDSATTIDLGGNYTVSAITTDGASVFVSVYDDAPGLVTIANGAATHEATQQVLNDLAVDASGNFIGCTGGSEPAYVTYDGTFAYETMGSLPNRCSNEDEYLPCWGGSAGQCAVHPEAPREVAMVEGHGVDDAPESTLWTWNGADLQSSDEMADESLLGMTRDGEPVTIGFYYIPNEENVYESHRQVRRGSQVVSDLEGGYSYDHQFATHDLDVLAWVDGDAEVAQASTFGSSAPLFTLENVDSYGLALATRGEHVAMVASTETALIASMGGEPVTIPLEQSDLVWERLEGAELTDDALFIFISKWTDAGETVYALRIPHAETSM